MKTAESERAAIVNYLRTCADIQGALASHNGTKRGQHNFHAQACTFAANCIEDGEHYGTYDLESLKKELGILNTTQTQGKAND